MHGRDAHATIRQMLRVMMATGGIAATNCYLVVDEEAREAVLFDAPNDTVGAVLDEAEKRELKLLGLWLTHGHFDHIADHQVVREKFPGAKILMHEADHPKLLEPGSSSFVLPFKIPAGKADEFVTDQQRLALGSHAVEVIHTPGHSPGHVMYYFPQDKLLIGGDLIIMGAVGRTDLPDSDEKQLFESIRKVMELPGETNLLAGHGQPSTLEQERVGNPYVQLALEQKA